jgi:hypothetical protein
METNACTVRDHCQWQWRIMSSVRGPTAHVSTRIALLLRQLHDLSWDGVPWHCAPKGPIIPGLMADGCGALPQLYWKLVTQKTGRTFAPVGSVHHKSHMAPGPKSPVENGTFCMAFAAEASVNQESTVFWIGTPCSVGGIYRFHLQSLKVMSK